MTIVKFPALVTGPPPDGRRDKRHADAFRELEGRLCDCVRMAHVAGDMAANAEDVDEDMLFAIGQTFAMIETLKVDYYAAYHGEKPLEP